MKTGPAVWLLCTALLSLQGADLYRVAGIVVNSETGKSLAHAHVHVLRTGTTQIVATQTTGDDGKFAFELPQGKFNLRAGLRETPESFGTRSPGSRLGTSIVTGPTHDTSNLTFRWFPPGGISGRIVDEYGEPVERALVQLLYSAMFNGRRSLVTSGWSWTDDRGEYRFGPLPGGSYFLAVTGTPWYSWYSRSRTSDHSSPSLAYRALYYPNATDASQAAPIIVKPGQEVRSDLSVSAVAGATLTVKHNAPSELNGLIGLLTESVGGRDGFQRQETFTGSRAPFTFEGVPPGRYIVRITGSVGTSGYSGRQTIDVNGLDLDVSVEVRPAPTISGKVQLKNPGAKPKGTLLASLVREDNGAVTSTLVRPDGSFVFPSVLATLWRPAIRGADGYFASDVHVEGVEFKDGVIDLRDGQR
jgi:hypothetical protein